MLYALLFIQNLEAVHFKSKVILKTENSQISKKITGFYYVMWTSAYNWHKERQKCELFSYVI